MGGTVRRIVLAAAPWPFVPSCVVPRLIRQTPYVSLKRAAYLVGYTAMIAAVGIWQPWLLLPVAFLVAAATGVQVRYGRASYGAERGLPPGGMRLVPSAPLMYHEHIARLFRRHGPVVKSRLPPFNQDTVCVLGLERGAAVLRQEEKGRLRWQGIVYDEIIPAGFLRSMMPPEHTRYRKLIREALSDSVVEACRPELACMARRTVDEMIEDAIAAGDRGIAPRAHLRAYTTVALSRLFYGVRPDDEELVEIRGLYADGGPLGARPKGDLRVMEAAARRLETLVKRRGAEALDALAHGRQPPPSFAASLAEASPGSLDDPNVTLNLVFVCGTAIRDVSALLHWMVKMLADAPEWQDRVRVDPASEVPSWIVLETLRLEQSEFISRRVVEPVEVDGHTIPRDWLLRICVRESHRAEGTFENPETFDPSRFDGSRFRRSEYSPFGMLRHSCLGVTTTMVTAEELVKALTARYRLATASDGPVVHDHVHWRPSPRQRLRLEPVAPAP